MTGSRSILVTGTGTTNKGAELLLLAIKQQFDAIDGDFRLVVPANFGPFPDRAKYGLWTLLPEVPRGRWWFAGKLMPQGFRTSMGVVAEDEIEAIIDASGFAFGDQLGAARVQQFAIDTKRWKKQGKKIVLMPQALGPFTNTAVRDAFEAVLRNVDLTFAREEVSFGYASELIPPGGKLGQSPDFTNLLMPISTSGGDIHALIVPNHQMIAKTDSAQSKAYVPFLARLLATLRERGLSTAVLLHDDRIDAKLVQPLRDEAESPVHVIEESDPLKLKYLLGRAQLVVGSRFHALCGSLSQGIPTIAVGWSHKYEMLLKDYGCPECVLNVNASKEEVSRLVSSILDSWKTRHEEIKSASSRLKRMSADMWRQTLEVIGV